MIVEMSKDGHPVLLFKDSTTASMETPSEEASRWIARHQTHLDLAQNVFVLGLGSGYHVSKLLGQKNLRRIWVVDDRKDAVHFYRRYHQFDQRFEFLTVKDSTEFFKNELVRTALLRTYHVMSFYPAIRHNAHLYRSIESVLLGRTPRALTELIAARSDFKLKRAKGLKVVNAVDPEILNVAQSLPTLLPILQSEYESSDRQRNLFKAVMELIK